MSMGKFTQPRDENMIAPCWLPENGQSPEAAAIPLIVALVALNAIYFASIVAKARHSGRLRHQENGPPFSRRLQSDPCQAMMIQTAVGSVGILVIRNTNNWCLSLSVVLSVDARVTVMAQPFAVQSPSLFEPGFRASLGADRALTACLF